jgi:hypothetical protein
MSISFGPSEHTEDRGLFDALQAELRRRFGEAYEIRRDPRAAFSARIESDSGEALEIVGLHG